MKNLIRNLLSRTGLLDVVVFFQRLMVFLAGLAAYAATGKTPQKTYQSMITLFCLSSGRSNDILSWLVSLVRPAPAFQPTQGVVGLLDIPELEQIKSNLEDKGYHIFRNRLPKETCEKLLRFSLEREALIRCGDGIPRIYRRGAPEGIRYDYDRKLLMESDVVRDLMQDPALRAIAAAYLKSEPILDTVEMWWHTDFSKTPDVEAAQFFHFDMDRIKWLKFFFYITDVNPENGPHCFVSGSHKTKGIPRALLRKGYTRLTDEEVLQYFDQRDIIEFSGVQGTIIAEDTRGLHKGKHVLSGDRLVFQLQYTNSGFAGAIHPPLERQDV